MNVPQVDVIIEEDDYEESIDDTQDIIDNHYRDFIDEVEDDHDGDYNDADDNKEYDDDGDDFIFQNDIEEEVDQESNYSDNDYDYDDDVENPDEALFSGRINSYTTISSSSSCSSSSRPVFKPARITDYFPVIPSSKRPTSTSNPTSKQPRNFLNYKKTKPKIPVPQAPMSEKNIKRQRKKNKRRFAKWAMERNASSIQLSNIVNNTNTQVPMVYSKGIETRKRKRVKQLIKKKEKKQKLQHKCEDHS